MLTWSALQQDAAADKIVLTYPIVLRIREAGKGYTYTFAAPAECLLMDSLDQAYCFSRRLDYIPDWRYP